MKKKPQSTPSRKQPAPARRPAKTTTFNWARYRVYAEFVAILALAFITYGNSIKNDYNLDDGYVVSLDNANPLTAKGIAGIPEILTSKYNAVEGLSYGYRPLGKVTMAIEYTFWGNNPHISHFINVLLFAINCFLLLLFVKRIAALLGYANDAVIYLGILLFIVHPVHTEVVCSIKNREEMLCFIFMLISLLCYLRFIGKERQWWNIPVFVFSLGLALLSKQTAINILGLMLLISLFISLIRSPETLMGIFKKMRKVIHWKTILSLLFLFLVLVADSYYVKTGAFLLMILILFSVYRPLITTSKSSFKFVSWQLIVFIAASVVLVYLVTGYIPKKIGEDTMMRSLETDPLYYFSQTHNFGNGAQTVLFYIGKLLVPYPLLYYYGYNMLPDRGWDSVFPYIALLAFAGVIVLLWYLITKKRNLFLIFWVLFFCITIFPFSNFGMVQFVTGIVAERVVFQASAGFCLVLAIGIYTAAGEIQKSMKTQRFSGRKLAWWLGMVFILPYFVITINRNTHWKNKQTLYDHDIPHLTNSARANFMAASNIMMTLDNSTMEREKSIEQARKYLYQAITISPNYTEAWLGLSNLYSQHLMNTDSALACLERTDSTNRNYPKVLMAFGDIYLFDLDSVQKALDYYHKAFQKNTNNKHVYLKISQVLRKEKMLDSLLAFAEIGIKKDWSEGYVNKGDAYIRMQDTAAAVKYYQRAIDMGYREARLIRNLAYYYNSKGQTDLLNRLPQ